MDLGCENIHFGGSRGFAESCVTMERGRRSGKGRENALVGV